MRKILNDTHLIGWFPLCVKKNVFTYNSVSEFTQISYHTNSSQHLTTQGKHVDN